MSATTLSKKSKKAETVAKVPKSVAKVEKFNVHKTIALKPRMSEKTYASSQATNTFVFDVPTSINKHSVAEAVQAQFGVTVVNVRTTIIKGKVKRTYRKRGKSVTGARVDIKKAFVTLKEGDSIPVFTAVEEQEKKEAKAVEKAEKKAKKEKK